MNHKFKYFQIKFCVSLHNLHFEGPRWCDNKFIFLASNTMILGTQLKYSSFLFNLKFSQHYTICSEATEDCPLTLLCWLELLTEDTWVIGPRWPPPPATELLPIELLPTKVVAPTSIVWGPPFGPLAICTMCPTDAFFWDGCPICCDGFKWPNGVE